MDIVCGKGISHYEVHGQTENSVEPIKCEKCDGFGVIFGVTNEL